MGVQFVVGLKPELENIAQVPLIPDRSGPIRNGVHQVHLTHKDFGEFVVEYHLLESIAGMAELVLETINPDDLTINRVFIQNPVEVPNDCVYRTYIKHFLPQSYVKEQHQHQPDQQARRRGVLVAVAVGLGDDFVAYDIDHRSGGKCKTPRQEWFGERDDRRAQDAADGFDMASGQCDEERIPLAISQAAQGDGNGQPFGGVL